MSAPLVRAADIARIADVSRAAVTGWLKSPDFPEVKADADTSSPLYDSSEVEAWLREHKRGRFRTRARSASHSPAFILMNILRGRLSTTSSIEVAGACLVLDHLLRNARKGPITHGPAKGFDLSTTLDIPPSGLRDIADRPGDIGRWAGMVVAQCPDLHDALAPLLSDQRDGPVDPDVFSALGRAIADVAPNRHAQVYDEVLDVDARITGAHTENAAVTQLFVDLLPTERGVVFDPASGYGTILLAAGSTHPNLRLVGADIDRTAVAVATRRAILRDRDIELHVDNSLGRGPLHRILADVVVTNPPWGLQNTPDIVDLADPRWVFGKPAQRDNGVWLQHAVSHLADHGRAFVLTPRGDLFKSGRTAQWRDEMLRRGAIEAIIGLPAGMLSPYTSIPSALWVLTRPGQSVDPERVLLAEAAPAKSRREAVDTSDVVALYKQWRHTGTIDDTDRAAVLTVRELLEPGAGLDPAAWLAKQTVIDPKDQLGEVRELAGQLTQTSVDTGFLADLPLVVPRQDARRQRLGSLAEVRRGVVRRISRDGSDEGEGAGKFKLLSPNTLEELRAGGRPDITYVDPGQVQRPVLTSPGDIYVCAAPVLGAKEILATILEDDEAGWLVPATAYLVRVDPTVADPWYVLACIRATSGKFFSTSSGVTSRLDVSKIEIPLLPLQEQEAIGAVMRQLNETADALTRQAAAAATLNTTISDAIATRSLTVRTS
ncbi:N-6 DNA methylase [Rhodococcus hoagii]|nr:N-6 DNA methylase [Prescottella equi]NKS99577.1 N-6 DNA methylase [Prescottella equi]